MSGMSPRASAAIRHNLDAQVLLKDAQLESVKASASLRAAELELEAVEKESRIVSEGVRQATERVEIARRHLHKAVDDEDRAANQIANGCRVLSGISKVSPASAG